MKEDCKNCTNLRNGDVITLDEKGRCSECKSEIATSMGNYSSMAAMTISDKDILNAIETLREADRQHKEELAKRSLKDFSKLDKFEEHLVNCNLPLQEKFFLKEAVYGLAMGNNLIVPSVIYDRVIADLKAWEVPQEVIDNILKSDYLPTE